MKKTKARLEIKKHMDSKMAWGPQVAIYLMDCALMQLKVANMWFDKIGDEIEDYESPLSELIDSLDILVRGASDALETVSKLVEISKRK
jgi:hypothetical protein